MDMAVTIKNKSAEALIKEVARETGETMTAAILHSLEERLERIKGRKTTTDLAEEIRNISRRCCELSDQDTRTAEEILAYDRKGLLS